jgi:hypothetical protein
MIYEYHYSCQILMKLEFSRQIVEKHSNIKFHKNPSSGSRVVPCGQTGRQIYMMKLTVTFRNFAKISPSAHNAFMCLVLISEQTATSALCKGKGKVASRGFFNTRPRGPIVFLPQQVPAFISRGATHHTDARDLYQRRRELTPNFASGSEFTRIPLGFFTCRKAGTWGILFYFPSEGRHTEDFSDAQKIQRLRPGLNPRTRVPVASICPM